MKFSSASIGHLALIGLCGFFFYQLIFRSPPWIFIDSVNLLIHEAGHLLFLPFGQFMHMIGGTVFQLLIPSVFIGYFWLKKEFFATAVQLFWLGNNFINVGIYMKDASFMNLPLLIDSSIHDWNWIFTQLGLLQSSEVIGNSVFVLGVLVLLMSLGGMIFFTVTKMLDHQ